MLAHPHTLIHAAAALALGVAAPAAAAQDPTLPPADRVRLAEAFTLADAVSDSVWPGWSATPFAVLLVTADHEFLIGHPAPDSTFRPLGTDPVLGREVLVRTRQFPPNLLASFPAVGGVPTVVIGQPAATGKSSTAWVLTLLHEHFHQLQTGRPDYYPGVAALDLAGDDQSGMWMLNYPFPYDSAPVGRRFAALERALVAALTDGGDPAAAFAALDALGQALSPKDRRYLQFQLWQEGIARWTELAVARAAARRHTPTAAFRALEDFTPYDREAARLRTELIEQMRSGDLAGRRRVAFYAVGAALGRLLERTDPAWQTAYWETPFTLGRR